MFTFLNKKKGQRSGFTLIELLVVIAIIGVLASIVLASLNNARRKSRDARRVTDIKQLQLALELYFDSVSEYPDALSSLVSTYIPVQPTDPIGAVAYPYIALLTASGSTCASATCLYYHMGANLEDQTTPGITSDADRCPTTIANVCTTLTGTNINGEDRATDDDGCAGSPGAGRWCYDVTP